MDWADKQWIWELPLTERTWSERIMFRVWQFCKFKEVL
jgi:hypothetical protein